MSTIFRTVREMPWKSSHSPETIRDAVVNWRTLNGPRGGNISSVCRCRVNPGVIRAGSFAGDIHHFDPGSARWSRCTPPFTERTWITEIIPIRAELNRIVVLSADGMTAVSDNGGESWRPSGFQGGNPGLTCMALHPLHHHFLLGGCMGGLKFSPDGGMTWEDFPYNADFQDVRAVAFHPSDPLQFAAADQLLHRSRVVLTRDGGRTFETLLEPSSHFGRIHSLQFTSAGDTLVAAGFGGDWTVARIEKPFDGDWIPMTAGLLSRKVTCLAASEGSDLYAGTEDQGVLRFHREQQSLQPTDGSRHRMQVKCIDVSEDGTVVAGYQHAGVAVYRSGQWRGFNDGLNARNLRLTAGDARTVMAESGGTLFILDPGSGEWIMENSLHDLRDIHRTGSRFHVCDELRGLHRHDTGDGSWTALETPDGRVQRVAGRCGGGDRQTIVCAEAAGRFRVYREDGAGGWEQLGGLIEGPLEIFRLACGSDWTALSTVAGVYRLQDGESNWSRAAVDSPSEIRPVAASKNHPDWLYAGIRNELILSTDKGKTFPANYVHRFPSRVTALHVSGDILDTVWLGTENGGVYACFSGNFWHRVAPRETGVTINDLHVYEDRGVHLLCAVDGISGGAAVLPAVKLSYERIDSRRLKLLFSLFNPCMDLEVDLYLVQIAGELPPVYYHFQDGELQAKSTPVYDRFKVKKGTYSDSIYIGDVATAENKENRFCAAICEAGTLVPITSPSGFAVRAQS